MPLTVAGPRRIHTDFRAPVPVKLFEIIGARGPELQGISWPDVSVIVQSARTSRREPAEVLWVKTLEVVSQLLRGSGFLLCLGPEV